MKKYTVRFIDSYGAKYDYTIEAGDYESACIKACERYDSDTTGENFQDKNDKEFCVVTDNKTGVAKPFECSGYFTKNFTADENVFSITKVIIKSYCPRSVTVYVPDTDRIVEVESFSLPSFINEDSVDKEYYVYCNKEKNIRFYNWKEIPS